MTRGELKRNILLRLAETPDQGREPLFLDEAVRMAANDVARRTDCYQTYFTMDIDGSPTAMGLFCWPDDLYKLKSIKIVHQDDTVENLTQRDGRIVTRTWMNQYQSRWDHAPNATGDVRYVILERPKMLLWPYPAYDKTGGVTLYGFATPGDQWTSSAPTDDDECPLPSYAHTAVELRGALIRALQFPTKENQTRYPILEREYERAVSFVGAAVAQEVSDASIYRGEL